MARITLLLMIAAICLFAMNAHADEKALLRDFNVTDGTIEQTADGHLTTGAKEMRAVLKKTDTAPSATIGFTYLGPASEVSHLGDGEVRHQFGIKLKAQDNCNLVYVMWNFDRQKIAVSVKLNPGQRTHEQCLDRGYINNIKPRASAPPPTVNAGQPHVLAAALTGQELVVKADNKVVWQGTLVPEVLGFSGPIGLRSDNARVVFDFTSGSR